MIYVYQHDVFYLNFDLCKYAQVMIQSDYFTWKNYSIYRDKKSIALYSSMHTSCGVYS